MNKQFKEWLLKFYNEFDTPIARKVLDQYWQEKRWAEKWGVYLEFFDSVGIMLRTPPNKAYISGRKTHYYLVEHKHIEYSDKEEYTRTEAQKAAIKKAFEILNKQK